MRKKEFKINVIKEHIIFVIGLIWLSVALIAQYIIRTKNLQYDDGGLGTILILGKPIYAFPFWIISESTMPLNINEFLSPYAIGILGFLGLDLLVCKYRQNKKRKENRKTKLKETKTL